VDGNGSRLLRRPERASCSSSRKRHRRSCRQGDVGGPVACQDHHDAAGHVFRSMITTFASTTALGALLRTAESVHRRRGQKRAPAGGAIQTRCCGGSLAPGLTQPSWVNQGRSGRQFMAFADVIRLASPSQPARSSPPAAGHRNSDRRPPSKCRSRRPRKRCCQSRPAISPPDERRTLRSVLTDRQAAADLGMGTRLAQEPAGSAEQLIFQGSAHCHGRLPGASASLAVGRLGIGLEQAG